MSEEKITKEDTIEAESAENGGNENPAENSASKTENRLPGAELNDEAFAEWLNSMGNEAKNKDSAEDSNVENENLPDSGSEEQDINDKTAELEAQLAETRDQLLRKAADFENFRKRINQEKQRAIEFANESLLLDIIPVIDDFERAIQSAESAGELAGLPAGKAMLDGITMIEKRLVNQLESKWGLKRFNSAGEPFDPNIHEAVYMEKSPDIDEPIVQEDLIKGYLLKDRVIRAAKVKVLMPANESTASSCAP